MAYTKGMGTGCLYKERGCGVYEGNGYWVRVYRKRGVAYTKGRSTGCAVKERGCGVYEGRGVGGVYGGRGWGMLREEGAYPEGSGMGRVSVKFIEEFCS